MWKNTGRLTKGCITSWVGMHSPWRQDPLRLQGVPSAQGKLPFLVEHCCVPSSWHHSWLQISLSEELGHWTNSSPNMCWHCWSRLYLKPGSSLGNGMVLSVTSSRQSPMVTTQRKETLHEIIVWFMGIKDFGWHDNIGKWFRAKMDNVTFIGILGFWILTFGRYFKSESFHCPHMILCYIQYTFVSWVFNDVCSLEWTLLATHVFYSNW